MKITQMTRVLSLLLAILMLSLAFVGCKKDNENPDETGKAEVTTVPEGEKDPYEGLRDLDFGGRNFTIYTYDAVSQKSWHQYFVENPDGATTVNEAVVKRNSEVESLLNVKVVQQLATYQGEDQTFGYLRDFVSTSTLADMVDYDLISFWATTTLDALMVENYLYNIKDVPHLKLNESYYNQSANNNFTLKDKQYFFVSDLTYPIQQRFAMLANIDILEEEGVLDSVGASSIYELVSSGNWTIDNLKLMIKNSYSPSANNMSGSPSTEDSYGLACNLNGMSRFLNNWGEDIVYVEYDAARGTNTFKFNTNPATDGMLDEKFNTLLNLIHNSENAVFCLPAHGAKNNNHYGMFQNGQAMFAVYSSDPWALVNEKYQNVHFAYLPYPKYTGQENYIVVQHGGLMALSSKTPDPEFSGACIEALSAASGLYVYDAYIQNYFESRVIQDPEGIEMYRIIRDNAYYDIARYVDPSTDKPGNKLCTGLLYYTYSLRENQQLSGRYAMYGEAISTAYMDLFIKLK